MITFHVIKTKNTFFLQERLTPANELQLCEAWPSGGAIEFRHVSLRYRPNLPLAIDDVFFNIGE